MVNLLIDIYVITSLILVVLCFGFTYHFLRYSSRYKSIQQTMLIMCILWPLVLLIGCSWVIGHCITIFSKVTVFVVTTILDGIFRK